MGLGGSPEGFSSPWNTTGFSWALQAGLTTGVGILS